MESHIGELELECREACRRLGKSVDAVKGYRGGKADTPFCARSCFALKLTLRLTCLYELFSVQLLPLFGTLLLRAHVVPFRFRQFAMLNMMRRSCSVLLLPLLYFRRGFHFRESLG